MWAWHFSACLLFFLLLFLYFVVCIRRHRKKFTFAISSLWWVSCYCRYTVDWVVELFKQAKHSGSRCPVQLRCALAEQQRVSHDTRGWEDCRGACSTSWWGPGHIVWCWRWWHWQWNDYASTSGQRDCSSLLGCITYRYVCLTVY